VSKIYL